MRRHQIPSWVYHEIKASPVVALAPDGVELRRWQDQLGTLASDSGWNREERDTWSEYFWFPYQGELAQVLLLTAPWGFTPMGKVAAKKVPVGLVPRRAGASNEASTTNAGRLLTVSPVTEHVPERDQWACKVFGGDPRHPHFESWQWVYPHAAFRLSDGSIYVWSLCPTTCGDFSAAYTAEEWASPETWADGAVAARIAGEVVGVPAHPWLVRGQLTAPAPTGGDVSPSAMPAPSGVLRIPSIAWRLSNERLRLDGVKDAAWVAEGVYPTCVGALIQWRQHISDPWQSLLWDGAEWKGAVRQPEPPESASVAPPETKWDAPRTEWVAEEEDGCISYRRCSV